MSIQDENENNGEFLIISDILNCYPGKIKKITKNKNISAKALTEINQNIINNRTIKENMNTTKQNIVYQKDTNGNRKNSKTLVAQGKRSKKSKKNILLKCITINFPIIKECPAELEESSKKQTNKINSKSVDKKIAHFNLNQNDTNVYYEIIQNTNQETNDKFQIDPIVRINVINWIFEKVGQFKTSNYFFFAVNIWDAFLLKSKKNYEEKQLYLYATVAILKSIRGDFPNHEFEIFLKKLLKDEKAKGYNLELEKEVTLQMNLDGFVYITLEKYIEAYFIQILIGHRKVAEEDKILPKIKETSKYLSKLILHFDSLEKERINFIAIGCIYSAFEILKTYMKEKMSEALLKMFNGWLNVYCKKKYIKKNDFYQLVWDMLEQFKFYQDIDFLKVKNLNKFSALNFLKK